MINNNLILVILNTLINLIDVLLVLLPVLLSVAFMTIIERKQLAAHQRRVGPNTVGKKQNNLKNLNNIFYILYKKYPELFIPVTDRNRSIKLYNTKLLYNLV